MRGHTLRTALVLTFLLSARMECQTETLAASVVAKATPQAPVSPRDELIARAKSLELNTPYVPPPGDPLDHHTAGFAKIMCSAVFITGLDPDFAAENVGYFTSPHAEHAKVGKPVIDRASKSVHITLPTGVTRTAKHLGDQGCVTLPTLSIASGRPRRFGCSDVTRGGGGSGGGAPCGRGRTARWRASGCDPSPHPRSR